MNIKNIKIWRSTMSIFRPYSMIIQTGVRDRNKTIYTMMQILNVALVNCRFTQIICSRMNNFSNWFKFNHIASVEIRIHIKRDTFANMKPYTVSNLKYLLLNLLSKSTTTSKEERHMTISSWLARLLNYG